MRLAIGRLLETSKLINTKAGAELADFMIARWEKFKAVKP